MSLGVYPHAMHVDIHPQTRRISFPTLTLHIETQTAAPALPFAGGAAGGNFQKYKLIQTHLKPIIHWLLKMYQDPEDHRQTRAKDHRQWIIGHGLIEGNSKDGGHAQSAVFQTETSRLLLIM